MHTRRFGSWETYSWETHSRNSFWMQWVLMERNFIVKLIMTHLDTATVSKMQRNQD